MSDTIRKLASIRKISEINSIPDADKIEVVTVDGWKVVVRKGEYQVNELVLYIEIDAWVPHELAPFLTKPDRFPSEYQGIKGERLKTIRLRGQISQGLILPVPEDMKCYMEGDDVTDALGIVKWEPPIDASLAGQVKGNFPYFIQKTRQERCQNLKREIALSFQNKELFEITEKLDGSSSTFFIKDGEFGVCSRNLQLKEDETNTFWKMAHKFNLEEKLKDLGANIAVQAELVGPKIQGNPYKLDDHQIFVFDIFDIDTYSYVNVDQRWDYICKLGLFSVPIIEFRINLLTANIDDLLKQAEGKSLLNPEIEREGLVYKSVTNPNFSFKVISNKFLLKQK